MSVTVMHYRNDTSCAADADLPGGENTQQALEKHLSEAHQLRKTTAFVYDEPPRKKSGNAERQRKFRDAKKQTGQVQVWLPAEDAKLIHDAGGLSLLLEQVQRSTSPTCNRDTDTASNSDESELTIDESLVLWSYRAAKWGWRSRSWVLICGYIGFVIYGFVTRPCF